MVIRILLLLLSALFLSQCAENKIELDQCGKTTDCFLRQSCIDGPQDTAKLVEYRNEKLVKDECDVTIQMRAYSDSKYHIIMKVIAGDPAQTFADSGVTLTQEVVQFACTKDGPTVNGQIFKLKINIDSSVDKNIAFCSFILETIDNEMILTHFRNNIANPTVAFTLGSSPQETIVFDSNGNMFWNSKITCDSEQIKSIESAIGDYVHHKIYTYSFAPIKCDASRTLFITREDGTIPMLKTGQLECSNNLWKYTEESTEKKIPRQEKFDVTCAERFCKLCSRFATSDGPGCSKPKAEDIEGNCKKYSCPDTNNLWMLNDGIIANGDSIECKQEIGVTGSREAFWYLATSADPIKVEKADCFDKTVCNKNAKFENSCPSDVECHAYNITSDKTEIFCEEEGLKLTWSYQSGIGQPSKLECDFQTGLFTDKESNTPMRHGYNIGCAGKETDKPVKAAQTNMGAIMGGVGGGLALLAGIGVIGFLLVRRRRNAGAAPKTRNSTEKSHMPTPDEDAANKKIPKRVREPWLTRTRTRPEIESTFRLGTQYNAGDFLGRILPEFVQFSLENRILAVYQVTAFNAYSDPPADADPNLHKDYGTMNQFWHLFKICEEKNLDCPITWDMIFRFLKIMIGMMQEVQLLNYDLERRIKARLVLFARPIFDELGWKIKEGEEASDTHMRFFVVRVLLWANEKDIREELHRQTIQPLHELESPLRAAVFLYACRFTPHGAAEMRTKYWKSVVIEDPKDEKKDKFGTMRQHLLYGLCNTYNVSSKHKKFMTMNDVLDRMVDFNFVPVDQTFSPVDMYWAYRGAIEYYTNCVEAVWAFAAKQNFAPRISAHRQLQMEAKLPPDAGEKEVEPLRTAWMKATVDTCYLVAECCTYRSMHKAFAENAVPHLKYAEQNNDELPHNKLLSERAENINWRLSSDATKTKTEGREKKTLQVKVVQEFEASFVTFENITPGVPREME